MLNFIKLSFITIFTFFLLSTSGCGSNDRPRLRFGAYFGAPLGIPYHDPNKLGKHGYSNFWGEKIGLVYTCKGGFIDLGHLRDAADKTTYCAKITYENLIGDKTEFDFRLIESSRYFVNINYPENWDSQVDKEKTAREIANKVGQYMAYTSIVWHEMLTWYGYRYTFLFSEYISAFSWEDVYSDVVGIEIAGRVFREEPKDYDTLVTKLIYDKLHDLDVRPAKVAKKAEKKIKGKWYTGTIYPFTKLKKRNLDVGIDDGYITPWLIPGICEDTEPVSYAVPNLDFLQEYGFSIDIKIEPRSRVRHKLLKVVYPDGNGKYIVPEKHFPTIMEDITKKEIVRNGPEVNVPNL